MTGEPVGGGVHGDVGAGPPLALDLPRDPSAAAQARQALEPLRGALGERRFGDVRLLVSELVADELRAREGAENGGLQLSASIDGDILRIELTDGWREDDAPADRPEPGDPGWGLYLTRILSDRWGVAPAGDGSRVWLELQL